MTLNTVTVDGKGRTNTNAMKIRARSRILLLLTVGSLVLSFASSFLHHHHHHQTSSISISSSLSSTTTTTRLSTRTRRIRLKHERSNSKRKLSSSLFEHNSIISQLAFYPTDESFSERLKNVLSEWDHVKRDGIGKFFSDEMNAAEKIVKGNMATAEENADRVILDTVVEGAGGNDDYLLKEGFHNMADTGIQLANEIRAVQQVFNEMNAAKIVEEAAEDVVSTGLLMEKDLAMVVQNVVSSLKEAEEVIQLALATVASKEGLTDSAREELTETLEAKARNIEESIKVANSVAKTAKQIAGEDQKVMSELGKTGDRLSDAIDTTTESLTETLKGVEGGEAIDAVSKIVSQAAAIVREDLSAAENIADAVGQKVVVEADAVLSIMDDEASESVEAVRAAKTTVQESTSNDASESLQTALSKNAEEIRANQDTAERLAEAIQQDSVNDQEAFEVLESSSREVNSLIDAVDGAVGKAAETVSGKDSDFDVVADAVEKAEEQMDEVEKSMSTVNDAVEKCQDCKVKEMMQEITEGEKISETANSDVEIESDQTANDKAHDEKESDQKKHDDIVSKSDNEDEVDSPADDKEQDIEVSLSKAEEIKPIDDEFNGEKVETIAHSEERHDGDEGMLTESHGLTTSTSGHAEEIVDFKDEKIGDTARMISEPTVTSTDSHDGYGLRDVVESVDHHRSVTMVDSSLTAESSHILDHDTLVDAVRIVSKGDHSTYSETAHEFSRLSTDAVTSVIAFVSSLYIG